MKKHIWVLLLIAALPAFAQTEKLVYHTIKTDAAGNIIPWYSAEPGKAYTNAVMSVWHFWDTMRTDMNGLPYYMNHQVWNESYNDTRGIAASQFEMALNSWSLLYRFCGDERLRENMKFIADYYVSHSLSPATAEWGSLPYPYNTLCYSGAYDGDMVIGKYYTQPDKAGAFGYELVKLYKLVGTGSHGQTPTGIYLEAAINIANTLAKHIVPGDSVTSPLPFKVHALLGKYGMIKDENDVAKKVQLFNYTSNWCGTMQLFLSLIEMKKGDTKKYQKSFDMLLAWMKKYPLQNNKWGPFFEDIAGYSETQINAITFAEFIMNHPQYFPRWQADVTHIFTWVYKSLGNTSWAKYGVTVINEQTAYQQAGNSHSAREAAAELHYMALTGDSSYLPNAVRMLNWATYMVDDDGKNFYPQDDIWMSDGYGDYVRHYLNAFAAVPSLAPTGEDHLLSSTSVIQYVEYKNGAIKRRPWQPINNATLRVRYIAYDATGEEVIRLAAKPSKILFDNKEISETRIQDAEGFQWKKLSSGGLLYINRVNAKEVLVLE